MSGASELVASHGCQCACHQAGGMEVAHAVDCCFAAGMTIETRTEWRCEVCGAVFATEDAAWDHWNNS